MYIYIYHRSLDTVCFSIDQGCFVRGCETTCFTNFWGLTSMIILVVDQLIWGSLTSPVCNGNPCGTTWTLSQIQGRCPVLCELLLPRAVFLDLPLPNT